MQRADFLVWNFSAGCAFLRPHETPYALWSDEVDPLFSYYRGKQLEFLSELSTHIQQSGFVFFVTADEATYPPTLAARFYRAGTPLLSHSHRLPVSSDVVLSPDFHFIEARGFHSLILDLHLKGKLWTQRSKSVFWRGSTTGAAPCESSARVRACKVALPLRWCDVKISTLVQGCQLHASSALLAPRAEEAAWVEHRGVLDLDGNVNAWGLFWRLASKSVVFRPESVYANRYILALKPWVHYVPVKADLSDLAEKTRLIESTRYKGQLAGMKKRALALTREFTYAKQLRMIAADLEACWTQLNNRSEPG
jgi:hypothetical protein